jgi:hypothetical protein
MSKRLVTSRGQYLERNGYLPYILSETDSDIASEIFPYAEGNLTKAELEDVFAIGIKREEDEIAFMEKVKKSPLYLTEKCPQCYSEEMNIYKINDLGYFCHCQYCDVSCSTKDYRSYLDKLDKSIWEQN